MAAPITTTQTLTLDAFMRLAAQNPIEIIDGEIIPRMSTVSIHNLLSKRIYHALYGLEMSGIGEVFHEATFVLTDERHWVKGSRIPDVMFYRRARLDAYRQTTPDWQYKPYLLVPDLAVEVISPSDAFSDIMRKVKLYLADGVEIIWVIDPLSQTAMVYTAHPTQTLTLMDTERLTLPTLHAEFSLALSSLFDLP